MNSDDAYISGRTPPIGDVASGGLSRNTRLRGRGNPYHAIAASLDEVELPPFRPYGYLEMARLVRAAQAGDVSARNRLWLCNCRIVYSVANRLHIPEQCIADLLQDGQLGIARTIASFDVSRMLDFSTYAFHWIRSRMRRGLTIALFSTAIPPYLFDEYRKFRRGVALASRCEWEQARQTWHLRDPKHYRRLLRLHAVANPIRLTRTMQVAAPTSGPREHAENDDRIAALHRALDTLTPRERNILLHRFGIGECPRETLRQIGERIGLTRERVRQIQRGAQDTLRERLYDWGLVARPAKSGPVAARGATRAAGCETSRDQAAQLGAPHT